MTCVPRVTWHMHALAQTRETEKVKSFAFRSIIISGTVAVDKKKYDDHLWYVGATIACECVIVMATYTCAG